MLAGGISWAMFQEDSITGTTIARGLRKISTSGAETPFTATGWPSLVGAFEAGLGIDAVGASGDLDYDLVSEETEAPVEIWELCIDPVTDEVVLEGIDAEDKCKVPPKE